MAFLVRLETTYSKFLTSKYCITWTKRVLWGSLFLFLLLNVVAFQHAYKFTHFSDQDVARTKDPTELSIYSKIKLLLTGVDNPKPKHKSLPTHPYKTIQVQSRNQLECWSIEIKNAKGTVILFHGFSGEKSSLLTRADEFIKLGYNTFLVDFTGSGGSEGNTTTIGFKEAQEVKDCFEFIQQQGEQNIILFGTSMGAAAILKASEDYSLQPNALVLECPFGSLYQTVCARFKIMGVPTFPMAGLLTFWGGVQSGYWAFNHNPSNYAKSVTCPTLLLFGQQDDRVSQEETDLIFKNLQGTKFLKNYPHAGHLVFTDDNQAEWRTDVSTFFEKNSSQL